MIVFSIVRFVRFWNQPVGIVVYTRHGGTARIYENSPSTYNPDGSNNGYSWFGGVIGKV